MNSQLNLTTKLRRLVLVAALAVSFIALQSGLAQSVANPNLFTGANQHSITIGNSGSFTLTLGMTTNFISSGYTVFYTMGGGSGLFQIVGRVNNNGVMTDPTTSDAVALAGTAGVLNPTNDFDLGYTGDQVNNQPAGTFNLQTLTINTLNAPNGQYTIFLDPRGVMTDHSTPTTFEDVAFTGGSPVFTVNVIPEPATIGLAVMGGAMLLVVARRKLASRA